MQDEFLRLLFWLFGLHSYYGLGTNAPFVILLLGDANKCLSSSGSENLDTTCKA